MEKTRRKQTDPTSGGPDLSAWAGIDLSSWAWADLAINWPDLVIDWPDLGEPAQTNSPGIGEDRLDTPAHQNGPGRAQTG